MREGGDFSERPATGAVRVTRRRALAQGVGFAAASLGLGGCGWLPVSEQSALARLHLPTSTPTMRTSPWNEPLPGPYRAPAPGELPARILRSSQRLVATYYFYWYDVSSGLHTQGACGALSLHPPTMTGFSTLSPAWHAQQMSDMHQAGIDIALPVYWGDDGSLVWSQGGLKAMVQALLAMEAAHLPHPQVGMFLDTTSLAAENGGQPVDITRAPGQAMFLGYVQSFYSLVPPVLRALIDGHPVVWLYSAGYIAKYDEASMRWFADEFAARFGARPYIVREASWCFPSDNVYAWGAAASGPSFLGVLEVGPGFDNLALTCEKHLVVHRDGGAFYRDSWQQALGHAGLRPQNNLAAVETWNELHEGTGVCDTAEYGRQYIELTRHYADLFHRGAGPDLRHDPYRNAASVSYTFAQTADARGLTLVRQPDGPVAPRQIQGRWAGVAQPNAYNAGYMYFAVDPAFAGAGGAFTAEVTYLDAGTGAFGLQYDSTLDTPPLCGAYVTANPQGVSLGNSGLWSTARFTLPFARFAGRENGGSALRLAIPAPGFAVHQVVLQRGG